MSRVLKPTTEAIEAALNTAKKQLTVGISDITNKNINIQINLEKLSDEAVISFSKPAWQKMQALIDINKKEVAWHAITQKTEKGMYKIVDIIMFPQTVTAATVVSDDNEYANWINNLDDETFNALRCHMHSHVNMGVSPSGTDRKYQNEVIQNEENYYIFMIWNKKNEFWASIIDVQDNIMYDINDISVVSPDENQYCNWANTVTEQYVKEPKPKTNNTAKSTYTQMKLEEIDRAHAEYDTADLDDMLELDNNVWEKWQRELDERTRMQGLRSW